jgi:PAS domain S-box-containing protein
MEEKVTILAPICSPRQREGRSMDLESANEALRREIGELKRAEVETRLLNTRLEDCVATRTAELKEANQTLAWMSRLVEHSNDAVIRLDPQGCLLSWNPAAERLYGYRIEEVLGRPLSMLAPEDLADETDELIERIKRGEHVESFQTTRVRKTGEHIRVSLTLSAIRNAAGEVEGVSKISHDITDRKRADEMFRLAVEAAPNAMVMVDGKGNIILVNAPTETMFGYRREELMGQDVDILLRVEDRGPHREHRSAFMHEPRARRMSGRELHGRRKDGTQFPVEVGLNPIHTDQGTWVLSAIVDISERKRAEEEIKSLNQDLERRVAERTAELGSAISELESFAYSVSHDLRAPLRQIAGFSKILVEECGSELSADSRKYLTRVHEGAQQMGALIDDLLNFAKIGRQPVKRRLTPLRAVIDQALDILKPEFEGREIEWQIDSLWSVECDPDLLRQVFINLLENALKYSRGRACAVIQVGQASLEQQQVVFVRDNGTGFDMRYADKLFGVFQRLHRAQEFEGTGVGLAIAQRIIHKHGGRIWAEAQPEKGATFFFTIPNGSGSLPTKNGDAGTERGKS